MCSKIWCCVLFSLWLQLVTIYFICRLFTSTGTYLPFLFDILDTFVMYEYFRFNDDIKFRILEYFVIAFAFLAFFYKLLDQVFSVSSQSLGLTSGLPPSVRKAGVGTPLKMLAASIKDDFIPVSTLYYLRDFIRLLEITIKLSINVDWGQRSRLKNNPDHFA